MIATHIDHEAYQTRVRRMPLAGLLFILRDAREAIEANPAGHKAGFYADEINYCASEVSRRKGGSVSPCKGGSGNRQAF